MITAKIWPAPFLDVTVDVPAVEKCGHYGITLHSAHNFAMTNFIYKFMQIFILARSSARERVLVGIVRVTIGLIRGVEIQRVPLRIREAAS